jgi:hypothetical protein
LDQSVICDDNRSFGSVSNLRRLRGLLPRPRPPGSSHRAFRSGPCRAVFTIDFRPTKAAPSLRPALASGCDLCGPRGGEDANDARDLVRLCGLLAARAGSRSAVGRTNVPTALERSGGADLTNPMNLRIRTTRTIRRILTARITRASDVSPPASSWRRQLRCVVATHTRVRQSPGSGSLPTAGLPPESTPLWCRQRTRGAASSTQGV